jgi:SAM-dependent methyltransferase
MGETDAAESVSAAAKYWDENVGHHITSFAQWNGCLSVQKHHWKLITGHHNYNPVDWFYNRFGPFQSMASIACGDGILERHVSENLMTSGRITGFDISRVSIERAAALAKSPLAHFEVQDANTAEWPSRIYDAVFAHGGLHHIEKLDFCIGQIAHGLKPGGMLYVNDYVGPARFQFSDTQLRLALELLAQVPQKFKTGLLPERCDPVGLAEMDNSEAVRPDHTYSAIRAYFTFVETFKLGGTLLAPIFGGSCLSRAIADTEGGLEIARKLVEAERQLIDDGMIGSDHLLIVARKRDDTSVSLEPKPKPERGPESVKGWRFGDLFRRWRS